MTDATPQREPLRASIAEEIRALLGRRNMSKIELARRIGKSHTYVWRRLDGATAFDVDDLEKIADVLGVEVLDLIPKGVTTRRYATAGVSVPTQRRAAVLREPVEVAA